MSNGITAATPDHGRGLDPATSTATSLLDGLKWRQPDAWDRFVYLYTPRIYRWCRGEGLSPDDAADVVQDVFAAVLKDLGKLRRLQPCGSFRAWLRSVTRHRIVDHFRDRKRSPAASGGEPAQQTLLQVPDSLDASESTAPTAEDDAVWRRALQMVGVEFENRTWQAFWRTVVDGEDPSHVAQELAMTVHAVYKARSRVLGRVRTLLGELEGDA